MNIIVTDPALDHLKGTINDERAVRIVARDTFE